MPKVEISFYDTVGNFNNLSKIEIEKAPNSIAEDLYYSR